MRRPLRTTATFLAVLAALALPGAASAAQEVEAEAAGLPAFRLTASGAYGYRGRDYVLPRARIVLRGAVKAPLAGQEARLEIRRGSRLVRRKRVMLNVADGKSVFHMAWRAGTKGRYRFRVVLNEEQRKVAGSGNSVRVRVVRTGIRSGSRGVSVRVFQYKLRKLHYVVPLNGRFDARMGRALMAFRKVTGMSRNYTAGRGVARKLAAGRGAFRLRYPGAGRHVEVSIRRQVMAFASNGKVLRIYHVSTGASSTPTVRGSYRVYMKSWGTNAKGMVHSSFFIRGYAVHGFAEVPPYPASHGCVRVPVPNAASIYRWIKIGTRVDTYY